MSVIRPILGSRSLGFASPTIQWAWVGNVSDDGATVKLRSTDASSISLRVSTSPTLSGFSTFSGTEGSDDVWSVDITGLNDDTQYYYGFAGSSLTGQFRTFPTPGTAHSFTIAAASCQGGPGRQYAGATANTSNTPAYDRMREHNPLLFIHMGDLHYRNLNVSAVTQYRTAYQDVLAESRISEFFRNVPTAYIWDDHDFGPNDSTGLYAGKTYARQAYGEYVPSWPLTGSGAIYQTFVVGRVRFILLDCRYERSSNTAADNSSKTRLGTVQKQWLKDTLDDSTEPCVVLDVQSYIGPTSSFSDGWDSFATERTELYDYWRANGHWDRLFLIGGDIHQLIKEDGSNSNAETSPSGNGPPYAGFAPMDNEYNNFSTVSTARYQTRHQQYGTMDFVDDGTDITVTARGWALSASPGATSTQQFSLQKVFS